MLRLNTLGGLWIGSANAGTQDGPRPRRLALLAILAAAGPKGLSRDQLLAVLWPESTTDRARHALSQTLYSLRQDLGVAAVLATPELRPDPAQITSDLEDFRSAVAAGDWALAATLYAGPFLEGFYLSDAPQFERWAEEERAHLARDGARALEHVARTAAADGRLEDAAERWGRLTRLDPLSGAYATAYMEAISGLGDRAGAIAHGKAHVDLVRRELDSESDPSVLRLVARLKGSGPVLDVEPPIPDTVAEHAPRAVPQPTDVHPSIVRPGVRRVLSPRLRLGVEAGIAALAFVVAVMMWRTSSAGAASDKSPVLAVGRVQDLVTPDSVQLGGVLSEMLATSLGRLTRLQVIANSRILELVPRGADTVRAARTDAARRAGATEILEGELIPLPGRQIRLELRRVDMERGIVRRGYQLSGADRMALLDSITVLIAADLRLPAPIGTLADVSTRSPIAYRLYEEGLRAFFQFDSYAANRLFNAAIGEDSSFAMATYYAWLTHLPINSSTQDAVADRAVALASHASDRDRLLILTHVGFARSDLKARPAAESLAALFPNDPEALIRAAQVIHELPRAAVMLNRSIALDSAAAAGATAVCRLCAAFSQLARRYDEADSVSAVEQTLRRWSRLRPADTSPWGALSDYLVGLGRKTDAEVAMRRADSLGAPRGLRNEFKLVWTLRSDDLGAADQICRTALSTTEGDDFDHYRWLCTIGLRMQGRYLDALALTRGGHLPGTRVVHRSGPPDRVNEAILDMEMGRPLAAANQFQELALAAARDANLSPGLIARAMAWNLTLSATAAAAGDDTIRVRSLADSVQEVGRRSLYGRDPLLHHFLRGLLLARAQQHEAAVRAFRAAMYSPTEGYTRVNYEMGRSLIALRRPAEAIPILRAPLHGGLEGSGLYLTRTETHELLARAFDAAGQPDSAAAHYAIVERAWRGADPPLAARHDAARSWLVRAAHLSPQP
ncbi:MAG: BTAD domain-containing putative transcriptional regulator [Gemmatimonadaceae bacterium]